MAYFIIFILAKGWCYFFLFDNKSDSFSPIRFFFISLFSMDEKKKKKTRYHESITKIYTQRRMPPVCDDGGGDAVDQKVTDEIPVTVVMTEE